MPGLRDHKPIKIDKFMGLWRRGDAENVPIDHFQDCNNVAYFDGGFRTRDGISPYRNIGEVGRMYNYITQNGEDVLVLNKLGEVYHVVSNTITYGPILTIPGMEDIGVVSIAGRAYITPFKSFVDENGINYEKGLEDQFVYVYKGDGTAARKAAGNPPVITGSPKPFLAFNSAVSGAVTAGVHLIAVSFDGGILGPQVFPVVISPGDKQIALNNIPIGGGGVASRTIAMTRAINQKDYVSNQASYTYYTALVIADNVTENILLDVADSALVSVYVPGVPAAPTSTALTAANTSTDGFNDYGLHIFGIVYETDTGYLTAPGPQFFAIQTAVDGKKAITLTNIPVSPDSFVTKRRIVATKSLPDFNGDQDGYQFFFVPNADIEDNTTTTKTFSFYDLDLIDDASHLIDNFAEIPAGVNLTTYHGRLVLVAEFDNISVARVSFVGEPEAISQVDGLIIAPLDGNPLTNAQEFRDVLYLFKKTRTLAYTDNGDVPSSWPLTVIDQGVGAPVHGVGQVLDSGGVNVDFLLIVDYSGLMLFNGAYTRPELSYKIVDYWFGLDRNEFRKLQIINDSLSQILYIALPDKRILYADYNDGLDFKNIKWAIWTFDLDITSLILVDTNKLLIGAAQIEEEVIGADITNIDFANAIDLGIPPIAAVQDVLVGTTPTSVVYYKFTTPAEGILAGVWVTSGYFGGSTVYRPQVRILNNAGALISGIGSSVNKRMLFGVLPNTTYYFQVTRNSGSVGVSNLAKVHIQVEMAPKMAISAGQVLVPDDTTNNIPGIILSAQYNFQYENAGNVVRSEFGDILPTGEICLAEESDFDIHFYDTNLVETKVIVGTSGAFTAVRTCNALSMFYVADSNGVLNRIPRTTLNIAQTWAIGVSLDTIGISPAGDILYYTTGAAPQAIKRWDLVNNVALADLVAGIVGNTVVDMLVMNDGNILVYYTQTGDDQILRYSPAGATLSTYVIENNTGTAVPRLAQALDPLTFWAVYHPTTSLIKFVNITASSGLVNKTIWHSSWSGGVWNGNEVPNPTMHFGPSPSCPFIFLEAGIENGAFANNAKGSGLGSIPSAGIYFLDTTARDDTYYWNTVPKLEGMVIAEMNPQTIDLKIPDPLVKFPLLGS